MVRLILLAISLAMLGVVSPLYAAPVDVKKLEKRKWTITESPNFSVLSDAKPKDIIEVVAQLERFRAFSLLLLGQKQQRAKDPIEIIVTKNRRTWRSMGLDNDTVSLTSTSEKGKKLVFTDVDGIKNSPLNKSNRGRGNVFRALAFAFFQDLELKQKVPVWYFRGFASYLAGYTESEDQVSIGNLGAMRGLLSELYTRNNTFKKIDVVALFSRRSFAQDWSGRPLSHNQKLEFSAQAYLMFNYLYADRSRRLQMSNYLNLRNSGLSIEDRIVQAFGKSAEELSSAVKHYATSSDIMIQTFKKDQVLQRLKLPEASETAQKKLDKKEFWNLMYPRLIRLSDSVITNQEKLELLQSVKPYLPIFESALGELEN